MRRSFGLFRFSPRPRSDRRQSAGFRGSGSLGYIENDAGRALETREPEASSRSSSRTATASRSPTAMSTSISPRPFAHRTRRHAAGRRLRLRQPSESDSTSASNAPRRGNVLAEYGAFYGGHKTAISVSQRAAGIHAAAVGRADLLVNRVELPQGSFTTHLAGSRVTYTMTPRMFASALCSTTRRTTRSAERAVAMGVPARQRAVRRLQRGARHVRPPLSRLSEPCLHRQDQSLAAVLT